MTNLPTAKWLFCAQPSVSIMTTKQAVRNRTPASSLIPHLASRKRGCAFLRSASMPAMTFVLAMLVSWFWNHTFPGLPTKKLTQDKSALDQMILSPLRYKYVFAICLISKSSSLGYPLDDLLFHNIRFHNHVLSTVDTSKSVHPSDLP
jgi:ABC-type uncharacterized transport system permease subunit